MKTKLKIVFLGTVMLFGLTGCDYYTEKSIDLSAPYTMVATQWAGDIAENCDEGYMTTADKRIYKNNAYYGEYDYYNSVTAKGDLGKEYGTGTTGSDYGITDYNSYYMEYRFEEKPYEGGEGVNDTTIKFDSKITATNGTLLDDYTVRFFDTDGYTAYRYVVTEKSPYTPEYLEAKVKQYKDTSGITKKEEEAAQKAQAEAEKQEKINTDKPIIKNVKNNRTYKASKKTIYVGTANRLKPTKVTVNGKRQKLGKRITKGKCKGYYKITLKRGKKASKKFTIKVFCKNSKTKAVKVKLKR